MPTKPKANHEVLLGSSVLFQDEAISSAGGTTTGEPLPLSGDTPTIQQAMDHYFDQAHLFGHVQDADHFEIPKILGGQIPLPDLIPGEASKIYGVPIFEGQITKFMVLELMAAGLLIWGFVWLAKRIQNGEKPVGKLANLLEVFVTFIRDEVARPAIGKHDADRFLPFLLTLFLFILLLNLFGMIPFLGSATGALSVTAVFAVITFLVVIISGMKKMGVVGFLKAQVPHMDLPPAMAIALVPMIWTIEIFGLFIKHLVLALRLFANMFGGHLVMAVFTAFIGVVWGTWLIWGVAPVVFAGSIAMSLLELLVAFLQAYIFTFLAALFIGSAQHAH